MVRRVNAHTQERDSSYAGFMGMPPTLICRMEAIALLVVDELQPEVMLAHDKSGTVSQLADCIRDRNPDMLKMLLKATKRGAW